ncbi:conserved hypothetical protein [Gammaproteobacteria bacterium]
MITIKVQGIDAVKKRLENIRKDLKPAINRALINTALAVRDAEQAEMKRIFDRATPWTLRGMTVQANPDEMSVMVGVTDPYWHRAQNYLTTQAEGGTRGLKALEKRLQYFGLMPQGWVAVPGKWARLDDFGNMSRGQVQQILSWFDAAEAWAGRTSNMGVKGREKRIRGTKKNVGWEYVLIPPDNKRGRLLPGIYQRTFDSPRSHIHPVLIFVRSATYKPRFNFGKVGRETIARVWQDKFRKSLDKAGIIVD